jgi:hypothetical protein
MHDMSDTSNLVEVGDKIVNTAPVKATLFRYACGRHPLHSPP